MIRSIVARTLTSVLTLAAVVAFASNASATYQIRITFPDSPPNGTLTNDQNPGVNALSGAKDGDTTTVNRIDMVSTSNTQFVYTFFGSRTLTFTTLNTTSNAPAQNSLSYNYSIVYNDGGSGAASGALKIEISRDDFSSPPAGLNVITASAGGTFNAGSNGTMEVMQGMQNGSNLYGQATKQFDTGAVGNSPATWSQNFSSLVTTTSPYTLTSVITLNFTNNNASFSGNGTISLVSAVPVPAGLVLVLTGLPMFGAMGWIRRRATILA
jgi:hypothetical protein